MIHEIIIILIVLLFYYFINKSYKDYFRVTKLEHHQKLLEHFLDISYEKIYKEQILIYSASSFKPDKKMQESILRDTIKLTFELMGEGNEKLLSEFYGSRQTLISNVILMFNNRLDSDEILETARKMKDIEKEK